MIDSLSGLPSELEGHSSEETSGMFTNRSLMGEVPAAYIKYVSKTIEQGLSQEVTTFRNEYIKKMVHDFEYKKQRDNEREQMFKNANLSGNGILSLREWKQFNLAEMEKAKELSGIEDLPNPSNTVLKESWKTF